MQTIWPSRVLGRQENPVLLFLHGFLGSGADWLPVAELCANEFFCIMPDLPGHGQNITRPFAVPLSFDVIATELCHLVIEVSAQPVHLVGYSMGGRIALYAATKFPDQFYSLTLEGASPGIAEAPARLERAAVDDQHAMQLSTQGIEPFIDAWYDMGLFSSLERRPQLLKTIKARRKQNNPQWVAKVIADLSPGRQPPLWDKLSAITMPVALLAGQLDAKYAALAATIATKIPNATVTIVPGCGHNVHLENPAHFAAQLLHFLAQNS